MPEIVETLQARYHKGANTESAAGGHLVPVSFRWHSSGRAGFDVREDHVGTLTVGSGLGIPSPPAVMFAFNAKQDGGDAQVDLAPTLRAGDFDESHANGGVMPAVCADLAVRRLTPVECERLMGWPDDWTRWADDGSEIADSHRYRACGNGVVANVTEWIGRRFPAEEST